MAKCSTRSLLSFLIWINTIQGAVPPFNWCYFFHGDCLPRCTGSTQPLGSYGNKAIQTLLCRESGWCCPKSFGSVATTTTEAPTTTPIITKTFMPECGVRGPSRKIIGGTEADNCEFQYMVHVARADSPCGGTIIDSRHILTAAHCFWDINGIKPVLTIGEYNRSRFDPLYEFKTTDYEYHLYETYNDRTYENDIAILRLKDPILFSKYGCMRPICVPKYGETFRNVDCTVTGWGVTDPYFDIFNPPLSEILLKVQIPIVDDSICIGIYNQAYYRNTNICAGDLRGGKDSCGGDSGGPLICRRNGRDYVAGIVSAGSGCAQINKSAIYTDVSAYTNWINNYISSGK